MANEQVLVHQSIRIPIWIRKVHTSASDLESEELVEGGESLCTFMWYEAIVQIDL